MSAGRYWIFTLVFWLLATGLMFVNALPVDHWRQVSFRFFYIPVLGVLLCAAQTLIFQAAGFRKLRYPQPWVAAMAIVAAMLTAMTLNLITFLLLDIDVSDRHAQLLHTGAPTYVLIYLFWSLIFFELDGRPLLGQAAAGNGYVDSLTVNHRGQPLTLSLDQVEYFAAAGDYVEIQLAEQAYLRKGTISALERLLDPTRFRRVHRSTIVNALLVKTIAPKGSGAYELCFPSGRKVSSSRSYLSTVQELQSRS